MTAFNIEKWSKNHPYSTGDRPSALRTLSQTVDFSKKLSAAASSAGGVASDTVKVIPIPAGVFVLGVRLKVLTAQGATCTIGVGDSAGATGYFSAANINTTTDSFSFNATTTPTLGVGKYYAAADDLLVTLNHTTNVAKVQFDMVLMDVDTTVNG